MFRNIKGKGRRSVRSKSSVNPDYDDTNMYRCRVCGWVCDFKKVERRQISGLDSSVKWQSGIAYTSSTDDANYVNIKRGCPFCGTLDSL